MHEAAFWQGIVLVKHHGALWAILTNAGFYLQSSAATSSGELRGSGGSSLEGTDDSHKSDCCSLNQRGDP